MHQVLDIEHDDRCAIGQQRQRRQVGHPAQPRIERTGRQVEFAEHRIDHEARAPAFLADHDDIDLVAANTRIAQIQLFGQRYQADVLAVDGQVLHALPGLHVGAFGAHQPLDAQQRKRVGLASDAHHHRARDRARDRHQQAETRAQPRVEYRRTLPSSSLSICRTTSSPTPRPLISLTCVAGRESGAEQHFAERLLVESGRIGCAAMRPSLTNLARMRSKSMPAPSSDDVDGEHAGTIGHADADAAFLGLAGVATCFGHLDAVVDRVAQQVGERRIETFEHVAVDRDLRALERPRARACPAACRCREPCADSRRRCR